MVRRSLNWVVLLSTFAIFGTIAAGLYVLHGWQLRRTAEELLTVVEAQEQEEEWEKAAEYLNRYLHLKPGDVEARGRLALDYARFAQTAESWMPKRQAIDLHYRALAAGETKQTTELRASLMQLLLDHRRFSEAENEARRIQSKEPDHRQAARVLAIALASQLADGSLASSNTKDLRLVKNIEKARKLNGDDVRIATILAVVYRDYPMVIQAEYPGISERERQQQADESLDQLVHDNPQSARAFLGRHAYRVKYGLREAQEDLQIALKIAPDDLEVLLTAAVGAYDEARRIQQSAGDKAKVDGHLRQAIGHFETLVAKPRQDRIASSFLGLGDTHLALSDLDRALAIWEDGLQQFRQPTTLLTFHARIAETCLEHDRLSRATTALDAIDQILGKLGGSVRRDEKLALSRAQDLRRASWHIKQQSLAAAVPLLRQVIVSQPRGDKDVQATVRAYMHLGTIYSAHGEWMDAATAFDQAGNLDPNLPQPRLAAATAWLYAGRVDLASERAEQALHHTSAAEAWLALAIAQLQQQSMLPSAQRSWLRLEKALAVLEDTQSQLRGEGWRVEFLKAEYLLTKAKATTGYESARAESVEVLKTAQAKYRDEKAFWPQLCIVYQSLGMEKEADQAVADFRAAKGTAGEVALIEARLARMRGDFARAQTLLTDALKSASDSDDDRLQAELLLVLLAAKDLRQARAVLLQQHARTPTQVGVIRRLAEVDLELRNLDAVQEWEKKLQGAGSLGDPQARYFRAWRLFLASTDDTDPQLHEGLRELEQVMLLRPNWAEAATLKGMTEQRLGRKEQAVAAYERAVQLGERRVIIFERLISLLDALNRSAEVDRYLGQLATDVPLSQRLAELAMVQEIRRDKPLQAVEIARTRTTQRPDDPLAQLWLGRLLMISGKTEEAEAALRRATELGATDARFWNALLDFYVRTNNREKIRFIVGQLDGSSALDATQRNLMLARAYELLGSLNEAQQSFTKAAEEAPGDLATQLRVAQFHMQSNPQQAKKHLENALKIDTVSKPAKQMLAIVHAALGELSEMESLLSAATEDGAIPADDVRLNALLLLQRGGEANIALAIAKLEGLVNRSQPTAQATDGLLLARLYEQQARLSDDAATREQRLKRAEAQLLAIAQRSDAVPQHLAGLIQFLSRHGRAKEAETWLTRLEGRIEAMPENDPTALALLIQLQIQQGSARRSEKWLQRLEKADSAPPLRAWALRTQVAIAVDSKADVEALIEPKATKVEEDVRTSDDRKRLFVSVGDIYFAAKRYPAAERWYRKLMGEDPNRYSQVARSVLRQGRISDAIAVCEQAARTDQTVQPALLLASVLVETTPSAADYERAEVLLATAMKKYESDPRLLYAMGLLRVMQKKDSDSIELFRRVVAASPRSIPALNNLAMLLADMPAGRVEALKLIDQAIEFAGNDASLLDTKAAILLYSGRSSEAVPLLEQATRDPDADPRHHFHLAIAYRDQGKIPEAKRQLETALGRQLASQILTNTDKQLLAELRTTLRL